MNALSDKPVRIASRKARWKIFIATEDTNAPKQYFELNHFTDGTQNRIYIEVLPSKSTGNGVKAELISPEEYSNTTEALLERLQKRITGSVPEDIFAIVQDCDSIDIKQKDKYIAEWCKKNKLTDSSFIAATSNPCFEIWIWLHFFEMTDELIKVLERVESSNRSQTMIAELTQKIDKFSPRPYRRKGKCVQKSAFTLEHIDMATLRARIQDQKRNSSSFWPTSFGSRVYKLVNKIFELKEQIKADSVGDSLFNASLFADGFKNR